MVDFDIRRKKCLDADGPQRVGAERNSSVRSLLFLEEPKSKTVLPCVGLTLSLNFLPSQVVGFSVPRVLLRFSLSFCSLVSFSSRGRFDDNLRRLAICRDELIDEASKLTEGDVRCRICDTAVTFLRNVVGISGAERHLSLQHLPIVGQRQLDHAVAEIGVVPSLP